MIDLHELVNMPGAGKATAALKKAGKWDEYEGLPYTNYKVEYSVRFMSDTTVKARSEDEAEELAAKKIADDHDCDDMDVEIDGVEAE